VRIFRGGYFIIMITAAREIATSSNSVFTPWGSPLKNDDNSVQKIIFLIPPGFFVACDLSVIDDSVLTRRSLSKRH
jgi:hypothetical protein